MYPDFLSSPAIGRPHDAGIVGEPKRDPSRAIYRRELGIAGTDPISLGIQATKVFAHQLDGSMDRKEAGLRLAGPSVVSS